MVIALPGLFLPDDFLRESNTASMRGGYLGLTFLHSIPFILLNALSG
jgi:hypothetical protein